MALNYNFILSEPMVHSGWSGGIFINTSLISRNHLHVKVFVWDFILGEINFFQFGVWSISHNCVDEIQWNETHCGCHFISIILTKMKFHFGDETSCKHCLIWDHMKGNTCTCTYFIKTKITGFKWMGRFSRTTPETKFILFRKVM